MRNVDPMTFVTLEIHPEPYRAAREILFKKGIAFQELINCVNCKIAEGDERILEIIEEAIKKKTEERITGGVTKTLKPNELFNILERVSPLNPK